MGILMNQMFRDISTIKNKKLSMSNASYIHIPSGRICRLKKNYGYVSTVFVEPFPISIMWGKEEYSDTIIVKTADLKPITDKS